MAKMARKWAGDGLIECQNNATAWGSKEAWLGERSHLARGARGATWREGREEPPGARGHLERSERQKRKALKVQAS
jgi:hypothetical protein